MRITLDVFGKTHFADLDRGIDLSIPVAVENSLNAYFAPPVRMEAFMEGDWIGEVKSGGPVNYRNIFFNPHGHGTHTECVGHIDEVISSVNTHFKQFHSLVQLISIEPELLQNRDQVITVDQLQSVELTGVDAVILRTLPNAMEKRDRNYSGTNPPYVHHEAIAYLVKNNCRHLILDLPSIDKESDEGKLLGHKAFWGYPTAPRMDCTVTELAYVPDHVQDGSYLLNLQVAPFENDAAPSRPIIYELQTA